MGDALVFPTPVGVFLAVECGKSGDPGLPHARGGVSRGRVRQKRRPRSSPRPWGCFQREADKRLLDIVFPTPVGVFPT